MKNKVIMSKILFICGLFFLLFSMNSLPAFAQDVSEITLEMVPGNYDILREFKITFRQDGSAAFNGKKSVSLIGKYHGTITKDEFRQLADLITAKRFFS